MLNFFFNSGGSLSICFLVASGRRKVKVSSNLSMSVKFIIILSNTDVAPLRSSSCCGWFAVEFRPEIHQADVQNFRDLPVDPQRRAAPLDGLGHSLFRVADVFRQRPEAVPRFEHDNFSIDNILIFDYSHFWRLMDKIIHPTIIPVNGVCFQVVCPRVLTDEQARDAVFLFLKTHKVKRKPSPGNVLPIEICNEFVLDFVQNQGDDHGGL